MKTILDQDSSLSVKKLNKNYSQRHVVNNVTFSIDTGEIVGLLGPNGAGKTTIFHLLIGYIRPKTGQIYLNDLDITRLPMFRRARLGISYLPQESSVFRKLTVEQNIMSVLETRRQLTRKQRQSHCDQLIEQLDINDLRHQRAFTLSSGERRRTEIARSMANKPKFLLLDEPFSGIDPLTVQAIKSTLTGLAKNGIGVLITDHSVRDTLEIANRSYIIGSGKLIAGGSRDEILNNKLAREIYLGVNFRI